MKNKFFIQLILHLTIIFGYIGVSNTDADVPLPLQMKMNLPSANTKKVSGMDVHQGRNQVRIKRDGVDNEHDAEMRLWDQIFANALAVSNTSQWNHLREIFDRVEEELHKTKSTGNGSLFQHQGGKNIIPFPSKSDTPFGPMPSPSPQTVVEHKHPQFSYHRVSGPPRWKGRPFAAVTLAVTTVPARESENADAVHADHAFSKESKSDQQYHLSSDADYQFDKTWDETLLKGDSSHFKKLHGDGTKFPSFGKFGGWETSFQEENLIEDVTPRPPKGRHHHRPKHSHYKSWDLVSGEKTIHRRNHHVHRKRRGRPHSHQHHQHQYQHHLHEDEREAEGRKRSVFDEFYD